MGNQAQTVAKVASEHTDKVKEEVVEQMTWWQSGAEYVWQYLSAHIMDFIAALLILLIGIWISRRIEHIACRLMDRAHVEPTVSGFLGQLLYFVMLIVVIITALGKAGVPTASFAAAIGGLGIGVGLALKDNVSNLASGLFILAFKPFRVGDYIAVGSDDGTVTAITMMHTNLKTLGHQNVIIPNQVIASSVVKNYSTHPTRCMELYLDVDYEHDPQLTIDVLRRIYEADSAVLNARTMEIGVREFADSSVRIYSSPEMRREEYWPTYHRLMQTIKKELELAGVSIPYPQRVMHIVHPRDVQADERQVQ